MENENNNIETLDQMWNTIEHFGIKRNIFEKSNPTFEQITELYHLIKKVKKNTNSFQNYQNSK
jgi:hypothetical protein